MALDTSIITDVMVANLGGTASTEQMTAINNFANALKAFVESGTIVYTSGLVAPGGSGGPVTGVFVGEIE